MTNKAVLETHGCCELCYWGCSGGAAYFSHRPSFFFAAPFHESRAVTPVRS